jgi:ADP-ribose pyrophosphatase YjhB (NUDIX family)
MKKIPQKLPYAEFKKIYSKVPRLCVDMIFIKDNGLLLIERAIDPGKGNWHFPGGTVLLGESIGECLKRVAEEETGLSVLDHELVGYMEFDDGENPHFHTVSMVFRINKFGGTLKGGEQGESLRFHSAVPEKIVAEQKDFLLKTGFLK